MPRESKEKVSSRRAAAAATKDKKKKTTGKDGKDGGNKRRTRVKDPLAPKRGLSAYMFFSQEHRKLVQTENQDASFGEIGKILGEKWKHMSERDKKPYVEKAEEDKKRYEAEKVAAAAKVKASQEDEDEDEEDEEEDE